MRVLFRLALAAALTGCGAAATPLGDTDGVGPEDDGGPVDDDGEDGPGDGSHGGDPTDGGDPSGGDPDVDCPPGLIACAGQCVDGSDDPLHCGGCTPCLPGNVCVDGECEASPDCTMEPCPGLTYCDLSSSLCLPGCAFDSQCEQNEVCELGSHQCVCATGFHDCGVCVSNDDPDNCGAECMQCPGGANGAASCNGGVCSLSCDNGFHDCAGSCVSDGDPDHCGDSCSPCAGDPNGEPTCNGSACGLSCDAGFELCGGDCSPCPAAGATATACDSGDCIATACDDGYVLVDGDCIFGCGGGSDCNSGEVCIDFDCIPITGSGYCSQDTHCDDNEYCDFETHECESAGAFAEECSDTCPHDCYDTWDGACVNGSCVQRGEDAPCRDDSWGRCGENMRCSPQTLTCQDLYCDNFSCADGLRCSSGSSCQQSCTPFCGGSSSLCFDGSTCFDQDDCYNNTGICENGWCTHQHACTTSSDCLSNDYVCIEDECTPYYDAVCSNDNDCDQAGLYCVEEVGLCGRN